MDKKTITKMLEYCGMSYKDIQPIKSNYTLKIIDDPETDVQCYIREKNNETYITFRGSDSCKDWIYDFKFWKKVIPYDNTSTNIRVHAGFINAYKSKNVRPQIHNLINKNTEKITITGHSYGAALAILCAIDLEYNFPKKDYEVYLFGSPKSCTLRPTHDLYTQLKMTIHLPSTHFSL